MLAEITGLLTDTFHTYPPHTIQRLSELVLEPRKHYKSLPAYLHAVDRVVHVTSGNNIYPLPPALPDMSHMHVNGATPDSASASAAREGSADRQEQLPTQAVWASNSNSSAHIGSDEALGGALLTPIPWLARRAANGGDGSSESGESSTLGSEAGGPSPAPPVSSSSAQTRQGRQFEMQVRTESTETIDGPNGMGSIETVSVSINGVSSMSAAQQQRVISQGELIKQEQRAGVVPVHRPGPLVVTSSTSTSNENTPDTTMGDSEADGKDASSEQSDDDMADEEEAPYARGPDLVGADDMGPQPGSPSSFSIRHTAHHEVHEIDFEAAVGRNHEAQVPSPHTEAAAAPTPDSSSGDDASVLTPTSSEADATTAPEPAQPTVEGEGKEEPQEAKREEHGLKIKTENENPDEDMRDDRPKSTTLSARSSPVKREAEDDISEAESEPKRLKSTTAAHEGEAPSGAADAPADAAPSEQPFIKSEADAGAAPQPEESKEDVAMQDADAGQAAPLVKVEEDMAAPFESSASAAAQEETPAAMEGVVKKEDDEEEQEQEAEPRPADAAAD